MNLNGQMISDYAKESASTWGGQINWMTASSYDATQAFLAAIAQVEKNFQKVDKKSVLKSMRKVELKKEYTSGETLKFDNSEPQGRKPPIFVEVVQKEKLPKILQCGVEFEVCFKPIKWMRYVWGHKTQQEIVTIVDRISPDDVQAEVVQDAGEELGDLLGRVLEAKIGMERIIARLENL